MSLRVYCQGGQDLSIKGFNNLMRKYFYSALSEIFACKTLEIPDKSMIRNYVLRKR